MEFLRKIYPVALILFAWSVCVTLYNMVTENEIKLLGYATEYYMIPLLVTNMAIIVTKFQRIKLYRLTALVFSWLFLILLIMLLHQNLKAVNIISVILWPSSYLASYLLVKSAPNYVKTFTRTFLVIFILSVFYFVVGKQEQRFIAKQELETASNAVYCVLTVLPFILMSPKRWISYAAILLTFLSVIYSNKRSAFVIFAIAVLPTLWFLTANKVRKMHTKQLIIITIIVVFLWQVFSYFEFNYLGGHLINRFESVEDDQGSGRFPLWFFVWTQIQQSDFISFLIGHGHNAVGLLGMATASHNDFLDVIYDYGIVMFCIYIAIHIRILKRFIYLYKTHSSFFPSYSFMYITFVVMSCVSILVVQARYLIYMGIYWGAIEAFIEVNRKNELTNKQRQN